MSKMFQVYGIGQALLPVLPPPLPFENAPTSNQTNYEIGQLVFTPPHSPTAFYLYGGGGNWVQFANSSGDIIAINGTANQVAVSTVAGVATISLIGPYTPATYTAHGVLIGEGTSSIVATATGTSGQLLQSGGSSADPTWTTATYPATTTANQLLYSSATNTVAGLGTANSGALITSSAGVPSITTSTNGQVLLGSTSGSPAFGTITSSTGLTFTAGSASLAINTTGGGLSAHATSGTSATGATQSSYICSNASQTTVSLPATSAVGDFFLICGTNANSGGWLISQATGQQIFNSTNHSTSGATGSISTAAANTSALLVCTAANTTWIAIATVGTVTYT